MNLTGRTAVITGGGRGVGAAAAYALAEAGATVAVAARNEEQVVDVAAQLRQRGYEAFAFRCDVTDHHQVRDLALSASETMGKVDILINNAGTATSNPLSEVKLQEWNHIMAVNATGIFLCTQAMYPGMVNRGVGAYRECRRHCWNRRGPGALGVRSGRARRSWVHEGDCQGGRGGTGVTVNAVCPGYVDTPLTDETVARRMQRTGQLWQEAMDSILEESGQPRLIRAEEVAEVIMPLLSEDASETNGQLVVIDGKDSP